MSARERLLEGLRADGLVIGEVTLASGRTAQYYVDARRALLRPAAFRATGELVADQARRLGAVAVGGPTLGADPVACSVLAGLSWYWPLGFAGLAAVALAGVLALRRRFADRAWVRAFDVLLHARHRTVLTLLLVVVLTVQPVRFWIALHAVGLDANALEALITFVWTSIINALPVGPGPASVGATVSVFGGEGVGAATASGLT